MDECGGYIPLMIDLSGRQVVVFGGGAVGERKALRFMKHADVFVYSRSFTPALSKAAEKCPRLHLMVRDPAEDLSDDGIKALIRDAFLVIPATGDRLFNDRVAALAARERILVNPVDGPGEVIVPSSVEKGGLLIAISSNGASPAITKHARVLIESVITDDFEKMIRLQEELRQTLKETVPDQKDRQEILRAVVGSEKVWQALAVSYEAGKIEAFSAAGLSHTDG